MKREILIVGSVPLASAENVFISLASRLGERAKRLPDGENGLLRSKWILSQKPVFEASKSFEPVPLLENTKYSNPPAFRLSSFGLADAVQFGRLGYAKWAATSFRVFSRLKSAGAIHSACRFQVCLPTPLAVITRFLDPEGQVVAMPHYVNAMRREIEEICTLVGPKELAIQFDISNEFGFIERVWSSPLVEEPLETILDVAAIANIVPQDAELGYHLCYGDFGHRHFVQPQNAEHLVTVANLLAKGTKRSIEWIHMPIPRERTDVAYFAPMQELHLHNSTMLFLGLIHLTDGIEGARQRMAAASHFVGSYGIATECGWGRRPPETIKDLIELHAIL